jgi:hypothetical protein
VTKGGAVFDSFCRHWIYISIPGASGNSAKDNAEKKFETEIVAFIVVDKGIRQPTYLNSFSFGIRDISELGSLGRRRFPQ